MSTRSSLGTWGAVVLTAALAVAAPAAFADVRVAGTVSDDNGTAQFTCFGTPTCSGTISVIINHHGCSNSFSFSADLTVTGFDLSHPGSPSGTVTISAQQSGTINNPDGTCTYQMGGGATWPYTATWDGTSGTITIVPTDGSGPKTGTFSASGVAAAPVFPMTVSGSVTPAAADVDATIQPRPQDVGTTGSIFVFAHAPSNLVIGGKRAAVGKSGIGGPKDDAIVCVLAQVSSSGQLVAVSASTMQAYLTGVLSAQSQAVTILNNVPTTNVAGATMYVGYGSSAASMISGGVYQAAITIPGAVQCTASLASAPAPESPGALTGLWWNSGESGWGVHFTQRRNLIFAAWYTYDGSGNPKWYVASDCAMPAGSTGVTGTCNGTLYEVGGPAFFGASFDPSLVHVAAAGTLQVAFQDANNASMSYTVAGQTRTVAITRQPLAAGSVPPAVDYSDLWWNPSESGWGLAMAQQYGVIFLAWYVYDASGKPVWYVASDCVVSGSSCSGTLYRTTGPPFGPTFDSTQIKVFEAGSVLVSFIDANNAVLSYTVDGVSATKTITRQVF
ncbi:MAG TPA: hypothetical protein VEG27_09230 [Usitatibacter sp.]|nr:hypothetical protein [Usitatibacter sp.]